MYTFKCSFRKNEYGEYIVRCYKDGKHYPDGDYFTDDKADALNTMNDLIRRSNMK